MNETDVNGSCFEPLVHTRDVWLIYGLSLSSEISAAVITVTWCVAVRSQLQLRCAWPFEYMHHFCIAPQQGRDRSPRLNVLHEKNDLKMTQSFQSFDDRNAFDLN